VVGTGGKSHTPLKTPPPNVEKFNGDTSGVLQLTLRPDRYDWKFVPVAGKTFTDSGSGTCH
jgi:acid phosphatase type 7